MFRGEADRDERVGGCDRQALPLAEALLERGWQHGLAAEEHVFALMPLRHTPRYYVNHFLEKCCLFGTGGEVVKCLCLTRVLWGVWFPRRGCFFPSRLLLFFRKTNPVKNPAGCPRREAVTRRPIREESIVFASLVIFSVFFFFVVSCVVRSPRQVRSPLGEWHESVGVEERATTRERRISERAAQRKNEACPPYVFVHPCICRTSLGSRDTAIHPHPPRLGLLLSEERLVRVMEEATAREESLLQTQELLKRFKKATNRCDLERNLL